MSSNPQQAAVMEQLSIKRHPGPPCEQSAKNNLKSQEFKYYDVPRNKKLKVIIQPPTPASPGGKD
jgi:hypothetical protein